MSAMQNFIGALIGDLKYAARLLSKRPGFTALTVLVMAVGIGLSVFLASLLNTLIFKDLPFKDGSSLVQISASRDGVRTIEPLNLHDYHEIRTYTEGLSEFSAFKNSSFVVSARDGARRYSGVAVEPNFFQLTRTDPILGRGFAEAENQSGAERVVIIGQEVWATYFGGSNSAIGERLRINGEPYRVIGVMPRGYQFPYTAKLWVPLQTTAAQVIRDEADSVYGLAHVQPGASAKSVNQEIAMIMRRIEQRYPDTNEGISAYIASIPLTGIGDGVPFIRSMQIVVLLIFVLASINVGNLLLSRAIEREKETAIRLALGAPQGRLVGQMFWESLIICGLGGLLGLLAVAWGLKVAESALASVLPDGPNFWWDFGVDGYTVTVFAMFVFLTILLTGLLPAWRNATGNFNAVLRDGTRGASGKKRGRLNRMLVISEIFVAIAVLIPATVMLLGNYLATRVDYGAEPNGIVTAQVLLPESRYELPNERTQFAQALQSNLLDSQAVEDVMIASAFPGTLAATPELALEGREYPGGTNFPKANYISVMPGTLGKLGVELRKGRYFDRSDDGIEKKSVIVTESFATLHFPDEEAIGKRIRIIGDEQDQANWLTIVGIVEHTIHGSPLMESRNNPSIFRPFTQSPSHLMTVAIRTRAELPGAASLLRRTLWAIDPELAAYRIEPYTQLISRLVTGLAFASVLFLCFGIAATVLAVSGIYGIMSNSISQETQEIGIKQALGATEQRIIREMIKRGLSQLTLGGIPGLIVGCTMGFGMSQYMGTSGAAIFGIGVLMVVVISGAVLIATHIPTKRGLTISPSTALRYQ